MTNTAPAGPYAGGGTDGGGAAVITPDAVGLDLPVATVGSRGIAWLLDLLVLVAGFLLLGIGLAIFGGGGWVPGWLGIALILVLIFAWQFGYPIVFELTLRGRTPGKMAMGLRVVTVEGAPIGLRHAVIRALLGVFELLMTVGAPAVVSSLVSRRGQRLGDLAAGTMVVRERRVGGPPQASVFVPPPGLEDYTARLDTSTIGPATYATIRDTLRRAPGMPSDTRYRITTRLATVVAPKVSPPPPAGVPAEPWLWCVAASVQARRGPAHPAAGSASAPAAPALVPSHPPAGDPVAPPADRRARDTAAPDRPGDTAAPDRPGDVDRGGPDEDGRPGRSGFSPLT